jgi:peptidoglycan/LPS O-acetylase OafA/YrhL
MHPGDSPVLVPEACTDPLASERPAPLRDEAAASTPPEVNTRFLLFLAAVLITNSHLQEFYPNPHFAGDGLLGGDMFFMVAGFGLAASSRRRTRPFLQYYWRRFIRIYPTFWLVTIPLVFYTGEVFSFSGRDYITKLLWPTDNTFVGPFMAYYIVIYFLLLPRNPRALWGAFLVLMVPCVCLSLRLHHLGSRIPENPWGQVLWQIAHFEGMLVGAGLAYLVPFLQRQRFVLLAGSSVLMFGLYIVLKYLFVATRLKDFFPILFLVIFALYVPLLGLASSPGLQVLLRRLPPVAFLINLMGACCLEIYFVQQVLISRTPIRSLGFPRNIGVLWILIVPCAYLIERLAAWIRSGCRHFSWRIGSSAGA